ncbi:MAG: methylated-DNA--[protein]-cysteine S-methyltransferase [bacterium]|nr:methylated-DNA--[protein]-cysteine S-methyltransferase [bacterium]
MRRGTTAFQEAVWDVLKQIRAGSVMTYAALAHAVGHPGAARAVANACAANPWPVMIPCHRVVRSDGTLGGYSGPGGIVRKAALLRREGVVIVGNRIQRTVP